MAPLSLQTEMSLTTAGIHCTVGQRLSGAMEDCFISPGPAAENALSAKVLYVCITAHVQVAVEPSVILLLFHALFNTVLCLGTGRAKEILVDGQRSVK